MAVDPLWDVSCGYALIVQVLTWLVVLSLEAHVEALNEQRLAYYIGNVQGWTRSVPVAIKAAEPAADTPFVFTCGVSICPPETYNPCVYWIDMARFCAHFDNTTSVVVTFGDATPTLNMFTPTWSSSSQASYDFRYVPIMTKVRSIQSKRGILLPLNGRRNLYNPTYKEMPWSQKRDGIVWRGSTTGSGKRRDYVHALSARGHNVSFTLPAVQGKDYWIANSRHAGQRMTKRQISSYKYVLSIEGNDVASNLMWLMASSSVVVMPTPTKEGWLMEGLLVPWVHYVPLDDPLNVDDLLTWLKAHEVECLTIVKNAQTWIRDIEAEDPSPYVDRIINTFRVS
eukprot:TRINITY_DN54273_c0_g1_i1.p1 TRINITY_DN54273_c0_g1~~TRINITY_DN54273_c0_g1_i1.p1  ORF type:complete len:340 (-),score=12.56 TRINITY_DN54273_c0_g1_i1:371-1390(-)